MANKCTQPVYPLEYGLLNSPDLINFDLNGKSFDNLDLGTTLNNVILKVFNYKTFNIKFI